MSVTAVAIAEVRENSTYQAFPALPESGPGDSAGSPHIPAVPHALAAIPTGPRLEVSISRLSGDAPCLCPRAPHSAGHEEVHSIKMGQMSVGNNCACKGTEPRTKGLGTPRTLAAQEQVGREP